MRKLITLILLCSWTLLPAQTELSFEKVIEADGTAEDLFIKSRDWINTFFVDANNVLVINDDERFQLLGNGSFLFESKIFIGHLVNSGYISFKIDIKTKHGKAKIDLFNFAHHGTPAQGTPANDFGLIFVDSCESGRGTKKNKDKVCQEILEVSKYNAQVIIKNFEDFLSKDLSSDW